MVGYCHLCNNCTDNLKNYCPKLIATYGGKYYDRTITYWGFFDTMMVDEHFIIRIPHNLPFDAATPFFAPESQCIAVNGTFDGIIDIISAQHPLLPLLGSLKTHGLVLIGAPEKLLELPSFPLLQGKSLWEEDNMRKFDWRDKGDSRDD
ncbi:hypothetical protein Gotur_011503 [Gossypium turneri]